MANTEHKLVASSRKEEGKGASRRLRRSGHVPAIVYGGHKDPESIKVEHNHLWTVSQNEWFYSSILSLEVSGIRYVKPFLEYSEDEWRKTIDVNLTGLFLCCRSAVPEMLKNGKGKIVNLSSVAGEFGRPFRIAYCASKGGAIAFTKALAVDLAGKNICVNALAPALIDTPLNATYANDGQLADVWGKELLVRRWGRPEDVAAAALYLASDDSDFVTGTVLTIDGGWTAGLLRANELQ